MKTPYTSVLLASILTLAATPILASETDERIEAAAKSSYVFRTFLNNDPIKAISKDGAVTLTGTVKEVGHKQLAQDTVAELPGVKSVENKIEIKDSPPEHSDTWLFLKVKSTLAFHRSVSAMNTTVAVNQGVATLTGEASSEAQKELTTAYTADIEGITSVKNEMTVAAATPAPVLSLAVMIDDASISAQVRGALFMHRSTSAFKTSVSTTNGVVTVGGSAKNNAEKDLVTKIVTDIHGVKSVVNNMIVELAAASN
jgi:osmotically-inducible protein OsmY